MNKQQSLFSAFDDEPDDVTPIRPDQAVSALDDLFRSTQAYSTSAEFLELMSFIKKFTQYSPFNCFLLHTQKPSVSYVATPSQWHNRFGRTIKKGARPLVILAPMRPVLFVFDAEDTEGEPLPATLIDPFATKGILAQGVWEKTVANLPRDRILLIEDDMRRDQAGWASALTSGDVMKIDGKKVKAYFKIQVNNTLDIGGRYATLTHELAHIYAGHCGTPNQEWWADRHEVGKEQCEFEAESISYLVCGRAGVETPSDAYLSEYLEKGREIPNISLDCVLKVAGQIEAMGKRMLKPRKDDATKPKV